MKTNKIFVTIIAASILLSACGANEPAAPTKPQVNIETTKPTATVIPTQSPAPTTASLSADSPKPTQPPKVGATDSARSSIVWALFYSSDGKTAKGLSKPLRITAEPNGSKEFRVGFFESEVGASGGQWRAAGWLATLFSAMLTGFDPTQTQVSFDVSGNIDGPSAGGLMTVGVLAALRGDKLRDDAAMTGTINPDGTIGPVGGIPYKIEGAAAQGKKFVLIPIGRNEGDVDLVQHGKNNNVDVVEVADIYAAYEFMTGSKLPRPISSGRPEVSGQIYDRMKAKTAEWHARYADYAAQVQTLPEAAKIEMVVGMAQQGDAAYQASLRQMNQGLVAAAYGQAANATALMSIAAGSGRVIEVYALQGLEGVKNMLAQNAAVDTKINAVADRLKAEKPKTLAQAGALVTAYGALMDAISMKWQVGDILASEVQNEEQAIELITTAALYLKIVDLKLEQARDILDMQTALGGAPLPANMPLKQTAEFFTRAADANINVFESIIVDQVAQANGWGLEQAKALMTKREFNYAQASASARLLPQILAKYFGKDEASDWARLGGAINAYGIATGLIAKYYSLDAQLDKELNVVGINRERALLNMLDLADEQARISIASLKKNDVDPALFVVGYEGARLNREGGVSDKLDALQSYWKAYVQSRAIAYLGGFAGKE